MEKEIFPQFDPFPRITRAANYIRRLLVNTNVPLRESDHYVREHFHPEEPSQPELPFEQGTS